jgi:hypothetical protein
VSLNPETGAISGTPTTAGDHAVTVKVKDAQGQEATRGYTIRVAPPPLLIETTDAGSCNIGAAHTVDLRASGGKGPYSWSLISGALPAGLALDAATGRISGNAAAAGRFSFTVQVTDASGVTASRSLGITVTAPALSVSVALADAAAGRQGRVNVSLGSQYPAPVRARLTLTFTPDAGLPDDPAIQFAIGGRTAELSLSAGSQTTSAPFQTGTVAGTIVITASFSAGGVDVTPSPAPQATFRIEPQPPVGTDSGARRTAGGLEVMLTGFVTDREAVSATFRFTASGGTVLQTSEFTVQVGQAFAAWFNNPDSRESGGLFRYTQPFSVQGDTTGIAGVSVTLSNLRGASQTLNLTF